MSGGAVVVAAPVGVVGTSGNEVDVTATGQLKVEATAATGSVGTNKIQGDTSGNIAEVSADKKLLVDSRPAREFGAVSAYGIPKFAFERILREYKFTEAVLQINFNQSITGTATVTTESPFIASLTSGTTASTGSIITTKFNHVHPVGKGLIGKFFIQYTDAATTGNKRCFGLYNDNEGFFVQLGDSSLSFVTRKSGVDTIIDSSTWDVPVTPNTNNNLWYIQSEGSGVGNFQLWYNEQLVHVVQNLGNVAGAIINQTDLPLRVENTNTTNTTDVGIKCDGAMVATEGEESVRLTDGINENRFSEDRRLLTQGFGSPLMEQSMDETLDLTNRWLQTIVGGATQSQPADTYTLYLDVTTAAADSVTLLFRENNLREAIGSFVEFEIGASFGSNLQAGNRREWGYIDNAGLNGIFFRVDGLDLKFVTVKGGVESVTDITESKPNPNFHLYKITHLGAGKIAGFIDNKQVINFAPAAVSVVGDSEKKPFIKMYNTAALAAVPSSCEFHWMALRDLSGTSVTVVGKDDNNAFKPVAVTTTGRLLVSQEPPTPPPDTFLVPLANRSDRSVVATTAGVDTIYTITNGRTLTIQSFNSGAANSNSGSIVELFEDPNGDLSVLNDISVSYLNDSNFSQALNETFTGDGTRRIVLRRKMGGGGSAEIFGLWQGFEQAI